MNAEASGGVTPGLIDSAFHWRVFLFFVSLFI